jgi:N-acetylglucosaminyldiphosphoundecaprenol N-acetyl-beta-D-mannosaminyltransferase
MLGRNDFLIGISMKKIQMLGCPMHILTMDQTLEVIDNSITEDNFIQHGVVNVAKLVNMRLDSQLDCSVKACDIINIDGM